MHSATVYGQITSKESGKPVRAAIVRVGPIQGYKPLTQETVKTDRDGRYKARLRWECEEPGRLAIDVRAKGYRIANWPWNVLFRNFRLWVGIAMLLCVLFVFGCQFFKPRCRRLSSMAVSAAAFPAVWSMLKENESHMR